jgi:hypothetical protein
VLLLPLSNKNRSTRIQNPKIRYFRKKYLYILAVKMLSSLDMEQPRARTTTLGFTVRKQSRFTRRV